MPAAGPAGLPCACVVRPGKLAALAACCRSGPASARFRPLTVRGPMRCPVNDRSGPPCCRVELPPWCVGPAGLLAILQRWPCCPGGAAALVRWPCWPLPIRPSIGPTRSRSGPPCCRAELLPLVRWPCWLLPIRPGVRGPGGAAALVRRHAGRAGLHRSRHAATPSRRAAGASHHAASRPRRARSRKRQLCCRLYRYAHHRAPQRTPQEATATLLLLSLRSRTPWMQTLMGLLLYARVGTVTPARLLCGVGDPKIWLVFLFFL